MWTPSQAFFTTIYLPLFHFPPSFFSLLSFFSLISLTAPSLIPCRAAHIPTYTPNLKPFFDPSFPYPFSCCPYVPCRLVYLVSVSCLCVLSCCFIVCVLSCFTVTISCLSLSIDLSISIHLSSLFSLSPANSVHDPSSSSKLRPSPRIHLPARDRLQSGDQRASATRSFGDSGISGNFFWVIFFRSSGAWGLWVISNDEK